MKTKNILTFLLSIGIFITSCKKPKPVPPRGDYDGGYFVLNEGQFMHDNASISFLKKNFEETEDSVYYKVNNENIGDIAQSLYARGDKMYIVVNNSNKILVTKRWTMKKTAEMTAYVKSPRYMTKIDNRYAALSNWGEVFDSNWSPVDDDFVAFVDTDNDVITDTLHVHLGAGKMLYQGGNLYVLIAGLGANNGGNEVAVIDPAARQVTGYITVGDRPADIVKDDNDQLWVLCSGNPSWTGNETAATIYQINPATNQVESSAFIPGGHPQFLTYIDGNLYTIIDNVLVKLIVNGNTLQIETLKDLASAGIQTPYGMDYADEKLFITDARDYQSAGKVFIFDARNQFNKIGEFTTGFLPNSVLLNE